MFAIPASGDDDSEPVVTEFELVWLQAFAFESSCVPCPNVSASVQRLQVDVVDESLQTRLFPKTTLCLL